MLPTHHSDAGAALSRGRFSLRRISGRWLAIICFLATITLLWFAAPVPYHLRPLESGLAPSDDKASPDTPLRPLPPPPSPPNGHIPSWEERKEAVRRAYIHAYTGYMKYAFPADELLATSAGKSNKFNGWSVTMLDSMDTMWMMGLKNEFAEAVHVYYYAPFFETVIRYLGGLLSAYAVSKEPILLSRADDLGTLLLPVFNATPSGFPAYSVNTKTGQTMHGWMGDSILFAEAASCQLEFKYLAKLTGRKEYFTAVNNVMDVIYATNAPDGLFALTWSKEGRPRNGHLEHFSVGASADSGYEYLLKQYLLTEDTKALDQYLKSVDGILNKLLFVTPTRELLYVASTNNGFAHHNLEHLACFLPGVLALGAHAIPASLLPEKTRERHRWAAQGLAYTCYVSYADMKSGLGPDGLTMKPGMLWAEKVANWQAGGRVGKPPGTKEGGRRDQGQRDYEVGSAVYLLRPEVRVSSSVDRLDTDLWGQTVESLYVMWRTTGDVKWRERGYEIFTAIERNARTQYGYASVDRVDNDVVQQIDDMPSFFLAETLKYLYLLFDDEDPYPFAKWVFNTEAHPLPTFQWTEWEKKRYNVTA
ncbi:hypothetical protein DXG03_008361 [Asterophora parasitica]|uniref:alpha-1,2-Mannosidase n=1 Tax=Asterophora parasitica TaxID=117018 RepID=A0A9P7KE39_9AGAR|nr:hypothetical protein DXG03_008361 [Asterophora parasitica]